MAIEQNQNYLHTGDIEFQGGVKITTGAVNGHVLTSDGTGNATWGASGSGVVQSATVTLSSADILSLHTTPIVLVAAQGAGTVIQLISATYSMTFNTTPYATDTTLRILNSGTVIQSDGTALSTASDYYRNSSLLTNYSVAGVNTYENGDVTVTTPSSNPTAGDSDVTITVLYSVINL
jgi:hypothetical protein